MLPLPGARLRLNTDLLPGLSSRIACEDLQDFSPAEKCWGDLAITPCAQGWLRSGTSSRISPLKSSPGWQAAGG